MSRYRGMRRQLFFKVQSSLEGGMVGVDALVLSPLVK